MKLGLQAGEDEVEVEDGVEVENEVEVVDEIEVEDEVENEVEHEVEVKVLQLPNVKSENFCQKTKLEVNVIRLKKNAPKLIYQINNFD